MSQSEKPFPLPLSLAVIALVVAGGGAAFAYTAGWLTPSRLSAETFVEALTPPTGPALGHRRNHAKGVCFTGEFVANGAGARLTKAQVFARGSYPVVGRFNLSGPNPQGPDAAARVRGLSLRIVTPDGQDWRTAMINAPIFAASTPQAFFELVKAQGSKDPEAMKRYVSAHPEFAPFGDWAKNGPWTGSYAEERYNSLNSFVFVDAQGAERAVRWSAAPATPPTPATVDELKARGPDFLDKDIAERVGAGAVVWKLSVTIARPGDPVADPTKAWPADRETVEVGELRATKVIPEPDGPCRDVNFDPTVLPSGMKTSSDPFPTARSAVYAASFDKRTAEAKSYPAQREEAKP